MPILKANAYGYGLVPVARHLASLGATTCGVALLEEAVALREAGITQPLPASGAPRPLAVGHGPPGLRPPAHPLPGGRLARDVLPGGPGHSVTSAVGSAWKREHCTDQNRGPWPSVTRRGTLGWTRLWFGVLTCVLSCAACTTFEDAGQPPSKMATIKITDLNTGRFYNVLFVGIDGIAELPWVPFVRVAPGLHQVSFKYYSGLTRFEGYPITLPLEAKAGRVYRIDGRAIEDRGRWVVWIIDDQTGEVVAGQIPLEPRAPSER